MARLRKVRPENVLTACLFKRGKKWVRKLHRPKHTQYVYTQACVCEKEGYGVQALLISVSV